MTTLDVVAGILWRDGRCLAVQRPAGTAHAGRWEFPGGKIEAGETPEQALIRELREELSVEARTLRFWTLREHTYVEPARHVRLRFFHVDSFLGEPRPNEGQALRWLWPREAPDLPFLEADRALVRELRQEDAPRSK